MQTAEHNESRQPAGFVANHDAHVRVWDRQQEEVEITVRLKRSRLAVLSKLISAMGCIVRQG